MTGEELDELLGVAGQAAQAGAAVALAWRERAGELTVEQKSGPGDLVSQADRESEDAVRALLAHRRPDDAVLGEEHGADTAQPGGLVWVVDPIDGTTNYLYGRNEWAVSVAVCEVAADGQPGQVLAGVVTEPAVHHTTAARLGGGTTGNGRPVRVLPTSELALAVVDLGLGRAARRARAGALYAELVPRVRDVRRSGSAASALAQVATGRAEACWSPDLAPWDLAAGVLLVREAGGTVGDLDGVVAGGLPPRDVLASGPALFDPLRRLLRGVYDGS